MPFLSRPVFALDRKLRDAGVRILMYHRVTDWPKDRLCVRPSEFEKQMDFLLSRGYRILALPELGRYNPPRRRSSPAVILTFDDGYRDFYDTVYPILRERRLPATVFVVPDFVEGKIDLRRYRDHPGENRSVSWDMLEEMKAHGIAVGAHSSTHRELTGLSAADARREIAGSGDMIERRLGDRPEWFSYPRGKHTAALDDMVRAAGYRGAVTVRPGPNRPPYDYYMLRRTEISRDDDLRDFRMKARGDYDLWHGLWQKMAGERL